MQVQVCIGCSGHLVGCECRRRCLKGREGRYGCLEDRRGQLEGREDHYGLLEDRGGWLEGRKGCRKCLKGRRR